MIYKSPNIAIFQNETQAKLMYENSSNIFVDGTFYSAPKGTYQIIITRIVLEEHHKYFTTSYSLAINKEENTYKEIFNKININIKQFQLNNNKKSIYKPKRIHCDMETALINSLNKIWPYLDIKICYFHWNQFMEKQRKNI